MKTFTIEVTAVDLADMVVGRFLRECPEAVDQINTDGTPEPFIDEDQRMILLPQDPHRDWLEVVLTDRGTQDISKALAEHARAVGKEVIDNTDSFWEMKA